MGIIRGEFVTEAIRERIDLVKERGWEFTTDGMEQYFIDLIAECGVNSDATPSAIADNALINGSFGYIGKFDLTKAEAKELCEQGNIMYYEDLESEKDYKERMERIDNLNKDIENAEQEINTQQEILEKINDKIESIDPDDKKNKTLLRELQIKKNRAEQEIKNLESYIETYNDELEKEQDESELAVIAYHF